MRRHCALLITLSVAALTPALATPVSFSFASAPGGSSASGGQISFSGGATDVSSGTSTFNFLNAIGGIGSGYSFDITSAPGEGSLVGLYGQINGTWTIGAVSSDGDTDTADVTAGNPGTLRVYQDANDYVEGFINFFTIQTIFQGAVGGVAGNGTLNVSGWTTHGAVTNSGLKDLISENSGTSSVSFTFNPEQTLSQLVTSPTAQSTSFSGTLATQAMTEPTELASLGADLSVLGVLLLLLRRHTVAR